MRPVGHTCLRTAAAFPETPEIRANFTTIARNYLLIGDQGVRIAVGDAMTVCASARQRAVSLNDWNHATNIAAAVVAAYLRGDELPEKFTRRLNEYRLEYAAPESATPDI